MAEAWLSPFAPPGLAPDFSAGLDEILPCLRATDDGSASDSDAYGTLISRAISEVVARRDKSRLAQGRASSVETEAIPADARILDFVDALFHESARRCGAIAEEVFSEDPDPQKVAVSLFAPAASCIGERWIADEADFLQVTVALARMQQLFSRMVADSPPAIQPDPARRLLLASAPGEQHGFGLSVVEDAFQRAGWAVDRCFGGEGGQLFRMAAASDYALIGVSIGSEQLLPALKPVVDRLRAVSRDRSAGLMAGGSVAVLHPQRVIELGFDFVANDASSGVRLAEAAVAQRIKGSPQQTFAH